MACMKTFSKRQPKIQLPKRVRNHESDCSMENPGIGPGTSRMRSGRSTIWANSPTGPVRESNPGPLAPKARIMPLDQQARLATQSLVPFLLAKVRNWWEDGLTIPWLLLKRVWSPWRNRLARSAVNRKVGGSSPPGDGNFCLPHQSEQKQIYIEEIVVALPLFRSALPIIQSKSPVRQQLSERSDFRTYGLHENFFQKATKNPAPKTCQKPWKRLFNGESGYRSRYLPHAKRALYHLS